MALRREKRGELHCDLVSLCPPKAKPRHVASTGRRCYQDGGDASVREGASEDMALEARAQRQAPLSQKQSRLALSPVDRGGRAFMTTSLQHSRTWRHLSLSI